MGRKAEKSASNQIWDSIDYYRLEFAHVELWQWYEIVLDL
jgi:hypothetical protein